MSDNNKKTLANRIKADLKKELESGDLTELSDYGLVSGNDNIFSINEYFICTLKHSIFKPDEFEKEDYDEIVKLIRQRLQLWKEELAKERRKKEEKLDNNPKLFYHSGCSKDKAGSYPTKDMRRYHEFWGRENGQDYYVNVAFDYPSLNNVIFSDKFDDPKNGNFYLIDGVENLPSEPNHPNHWEVEGHFFKWVELKDNITITPYNEENGNGLLKDLEKNDVSELRKRGNFCDGCHKSLPSQALSDHFYLMKNLCWEGNEIKIDKGLLIWACQDCYLTKEQEYLQKYNEICETCYEDENGELFYRWIKKFPRSHDTKKSDQSGKDNKAVINFLIRYFQEHNIKKITFENDQLVITHNNNNNNNEIISKGNITSELQVVKDFSQKNNKREIELEELKSIINTNHYPAEKANDNTLLIVCGIGGTLTIGVVIGMLINKKRHKNK